MNFNELINSTVLYTTNPTSSEANKSIKIFSKLYKNLVLKRFIVRSQQHELRLINNNNNYIVYLENENDIITELKFTAQDLIQFQYNKTEEYYFSLDIIHKDLKNVLEYISVLYHCMNQNIEEIHKHTTQEESLLYFYEVCRNNNEQQ